MGPLAGEIGNHAIDAHGGERQSQSGEDREQNHGQALLGNRIGNNLFHRTRVVDHRAAVHFSFAFANAADHATRRAGRARHPADPIGEQRPKAVGYLPDQKVDLRLQILVLARTETPVLDVAGDTDNFRLQVQQADVEVFAYRILAGKMFSGETGIDDGDHGSVLVVPYVEEAAPLQRNAHGRRVPGGHQIEQRERHLVLVSGFGLPFDPKGNLGVAGHGKRAAHHRNVFNARNTLKLPQALAIFRTKLAGRNVRRGSERNVIGQDAASIESGIYSPKSGEAANHQACSDEQHQRHGHLEDDENALRAMSHATRAAATLLQRFVHIGTQGFYRRDQAEENAGKEGNANGEEEHMRIDSDFFGAGQRCRQSREDCARAPFGQQQADQAAANPEDHAFGEQLADYPRRTRTERGANGELAGASGGTSQQQVGNIGASDQQNEADRAEQHQQNAANIADHIGFEWNQRDAAAGIGFRVGSGKIRANAVHLRARFLEGDSGFEASDRVHAHADAAIAKGSVGPLADGNENVSGTEDGSTVRRNSHNGIGLAIQGQSFAQNVVGGCELALPEPVAKQRHGSRAGLIFFRAEIPAERQRNPQRGKKFRGDHVAVQALGLADAGQVVAFAAEGA